MESWDSTRYTLFALRCWLVGSSVCRVNLWMKLTELYGAGMEYARMSRDQTAVLHPTKSESRCLLPKAKGKERRGTAALLRVPGAFALFGAQHPLQGIGSAPWLVVVSHLHLAKQAKGQQLYPSQNEHRSKDHQRPVLLHDIPARVEDLQPELGCHGGAR